MTSIRARQPYARRPAPQNDLKPFLDTEFANVQRAIPVPLVRAVFADDTVQASDDTIEVDATAGAVTVTLPPADRLQFLRVTIIRVNDGGHGVVVSGDINGTSSIALQSQGDSLTLQSDGAAWLVLGAMPIVFSVTRFGAVGNGSHDDTVAFQNAAAAACTAATLGFGAFLYIPTPPSCYVITDTITINAHRVHIRGDGKYAAAIAFTPASAKALFKFQAADTAAVLYQCSVKGLGLLGGGTQQKIAFDFWDQSECHVEDIAIAASWTGNSGNSHNGAADALSTPSIGIRTHGRELFTVKRVDIFCDRPVHLLRNANAPSLSVDVFHFEDCYLSPIVASEYAYVIDGDVGMATFDINHQSWVGGTGGLWFKSGTVPSTVLGVQIANVRYEEPAVSGGYAVRWEASTIGLTLDNVNAGGTGPSNNGFYFRNVTKLTLANTLYTGTAVALDADDSVIDIDLVNTFWQDSGTAVLGTHVLESISQARSSALAPLPSTAHYYNSLATPTPTIAARGPIAVTNGSYSTKGSVATTTATFATAFTPTAAGRYLVAWTISSFGGGNNYSGLAELLHDGAAVYLMASTLGISAACQLSAGAFQIKQSSGSNQTLNWTYQLIPF